MIFLCHVPFCLFYHSWRIEQPLIPHHIKDTTGTSRSHCHCRLQAFCLVVSTSYQWFTSQSRYFFTMLSYRLQPFCAMTKLKSLHLWRYVYFKKYSQAVILTVTCGTRSISVTMTHLDLDTTWAEWDLGVLRAGTAWWNKIKKKLFSWITFKFVTWAPMTLAFLRCNLYARRAWKPF